MKEMLKRIFLVAFILLVLTAVSGFFYLQKHPMNSMKATGKNLNFSGRISK
ncbi:hypothetical protein [Chryseobacterium sp. Leaf201]|uniref:hypothetical protein n=1 Tax=Chryseobacterium sp. Leaf201 TaxID=1735672 RepID=UPI000AE1B211|nr:hypothetical protein [Chryseobacterium sp. Leaf201]